MANQVKRSLTPFGEKIKIALIKKRMTQKALAAQIGIAEQTLIEIIYGARTEAYIKDKAFSALDIKDGEE